MHVKDYENVTVEFSWPNSEYLLLDWNSDIIFWHLVVAAAYD